jgi:hypothetical protein
MYFTLNGNLIKIIINTSITINTNVNLIISDFCVTLQAGHTLINSYVLGISKAKFRNINRYLPYSK